MCEGVISDHFTTPALQGVQQRVFPDGHPSSSYQSHLTCHRTLVKKWEVVFSFGKRVVYFSFVLLLSFFLLSFVFVVPASNLVTSSAQSITAPTELNLNCLADGIPTPTIFWTRVSDNTNVSMPLNIIGGKNEESYQCTADNGVGNPLSKVVKITILCE